MVLKCLAFIRRKVKRAQFGFNCKQPESTSKSLCTSLDTAPSREYKLTFKRINLQIH